jgi:Holliday junction DNA helicase RuvB
MNAPAPRLIQPTPHPVDGAETNLRPPKLAEFVGQRELKDNLEVFLQAAKRRGQALDHVLFHGPPGLGKTTLAHIIAQEMGVNVRITAGPMLTKAGDLAAILTNLQASDVLFIDEIHRLPTTVEEVLYSAMEDFKLDLVIGEGPAARSIRIDVPRFTLVGATTRLGLLSNPLRDRFGIPLRLRFYDADELEQVVTRGAKLLGMAIHKDGAQEIATRSRGTPRIALRLLRRVHDFACVANKQEIDQPIAQYALTKLEVDARGLDSADMRYLTVLAEHYQGGPAGIETLAAALSEQRDVLEETIEPYLLQIGLLQRTPRGRMLTAQGYMHLGLPAPKQAVSGGQMDWVEGG